MSDALRSFQDALIVARIVAAKQKTFLEARQAILELLKSKGWKVVTGLKIPHATSPDFKLRLWFKAQAVYYTQGEGAICDVRP